MFLTSVENLQNILIGWLVVMCLWLLLRTCKTSMMCLWLLLRTCKTSVMCLWLLWRTCKTSSLVDFWWCVCDFCWGLAKQRRCVSDFYRYEFAKQPHWLACGDVFVTSVENLQNIDDVFVTSVKNLQNIGDVFVTSVKNLQNILTGRLLVMCLWLLLRTCKTAAMCFWRRFLKTCNTSSLVGLWWCVCDFC